MGIPIVINFCRKIYFRVVIDHQIIGIETISILMQEKRRVLFKVSIMLKVCPDY